MMVSARLNSVEGFVRQILGWREFIRIYYEAMMPDVRDANHFGFTKKLPEMYWSGETIMTCMQQSIKPVIEEGYSHHIQRLMILSNFSNLTETDPRELNRWFWFSYIDAYKWVELPNVLGISTFADGGVLASKPYVSSGNYINKMSDYCRHCDYSVTKKKPERKHVRLTTSTGTSLINNERRLMKAAGSILWSTCLITKKRISRKKKSVNPRKHFFQS